LGCRACGRRLDVLHCEAQRALLALADGRRHAKGTRDTERFAGLNRAVWDGAHYEVHVDRIFYHCQVWMRTRDEIAEC